MHICYIYIYTYILWDYIGIIFLYTKQYRHSAFSLGGLRFKALGLGFAVISGGFGSMVPGLTVGLWSFRV